MPSGRKPLPFLATVMTLLLLCAACATPTRRAIALPPPRVATPPPPPATIPPPVVPPQPTPVPPPVPRIVHVLYFYFAPEACPHCRAMAPVVQRFYERYGPKRAPAARAAPLYLVSVEPHPVQLPERGVEVEVYGVPIGGWGTDVDGFKRRTGSTFPISANPGLPVDTSRHPVTVFHNKQTNVHRLASVGAVSYEDLTTAYRSYLDGRPASPRTGGY